MPISAQADLPFAKDPVSGRKVFIKPKPVHGPRLDMATHYASKPTPGFQPDFWRNGSSASAHFNTAWFVPSYLQPGYSPQTDQTVFANRLAAEDVKRGVSLVISLYLRNILPPLPRKGLAAPLKQKLTLKQGNWSNIPIPSRLRILSKLGL